MKKNVGQLGFGSFVGIVIVLAYGLIVYARFHFEQKSSPQDAITKRLNELEKKSIENQTKLDHMQDALNEIRSETVQSDATKAKSKQHH